ncbi:hypothetical protein MATL_G00016120 [Megalops atlanticus]|uniref:Uncharacterized protein n=1 Tax=Megalops atlanticus TaxID=7932 RepID=A0A9D3QH27_MEGAT|nr:hypothetical protein MATL_G00016120 [Megalops atlanticus]
MFHDVVGVGRLCRPIFRSKGTESRRCHHDVDTDRGLLLLILADSYSGPGEPSVWTSAEERNHLVSALLLGVNFSSRVTMPVWGPSSSFPCIPTDAVRT